MGQMKTKFKMIYINYYIKIKLNKESKLNAINYQAGNEQNIFQKYAAYNKRTLNISTLKV